MTSRPATHFYPVEPADPASANNNFFLGPQPSSFRCCPSCLILARSVARLAYHLGFDETGDELTDMLGEEEINTEAVNQ